jgi:hypothetical protein
MNHDETFDELESQLAVELAAVRPADAPAELRGAVLGSVHRELRAARWDRRLARVAAILLAVGIGLNAYQVVAPMRAAVPHSRPVARVESSEKLIQTAIVVAEATNADTGRLFARQWAAMSGRALTERELDAIDTSHRDQG